MIKQFAQQIENEFNENPDALIQEFPDRLETEDGFVPQINWAEFILSRIDSAYPELDEDECDELLEEIREELCV